MELITKNSCLLVSDMESHINEIIEIINTVVDYFDFPCVVLRKFQDLHNRSCPQKVESCRLSEVFDLLETADIKNGIELLKNDEYFIIAAYGQIYTAGNTMQYKIEAFQIMPYDSNRNFINVLPILDGAEPCMAINQLN